MNRIKVLTVFGTRPEAIKMAPLIKEMKSREEFDCKVLVTAQHREMLDSVLKLFNIEPDFDLNIMTHGQTITDITSRVLYGCEEVLDKYTPDVILVHGDTTTTFAASLAAFYKKIPVGHIEAGLRSENMYSPYPEEMNRRLTGRLSTYHFSPTKTNRENLVREDISTKNIVVTGNTVIDALLQVVKKDYEFEDEMLKSIDFENKKVILLTCHRRENWGEPMEEIFRAVKSIVKENPDTHLIFPMHLNPIVRDAAKSILGDSDRISLIEPLDYEPFANLMAKSYLLLTDSGGVQEEAPALGKPVVVLRTETERPEAVEAGTVKVAGVKEEKVYQISDRLIRDKSYYESVANAVNPYGDGKASIRIADYLLYKFGILNKEIDEFK
ncbi:UDP-N-acetylglucosamine 2-epimerase (non-hydrolyzing) [Acetoanaerobium pronyense]|uniref:UDP-N-acetylglucosamine 2-epimerase (non-hydrolyzing) n=1 Tax=Acetoanaerobium pronyense TaxID=1482736 RepID=A0ABS4KJM8_9FIRM|nr:UDP-N-acetylglucosamine 2-epimerase (non-hydrolyzing) [Acetoanaerobium pronyense]MBP2027987.1 UDP-N-acetylglucosamine 2-epimerase (non-hydrolyzing) [Acetoanaerobium pronyense]